jgi:hypothetical protein
MCTICSILSRKSALTIDTSSMMSTEQLRKRFLVCGVCIFCQSRILRGTISVWRAETPEHQMGNTHTLREFKRVRERVQESSREFESSRVRERVQERERERDPNQEGQHANISHKHAYTYTHTHTHTTSHIHAHNFTHTHTYTHTHTHNTYHRSQQTSE